MKKTNVCGIVPVKELGISKERLSSVLTPEERMALTLAMLEDVLNTLQASKIHEVLIVSVDPPVRKIATMHGFSHIYPKQAGLNPSIDEAIEWYVEKKADSVLILPADIPAASVEDIDSLISLGTDEQTVVLTPSLNGGTNALLLNPAKLIRVSFGIGSFFTHIQEAIEKRATIRFHSSRGIMLDVDSAEDLDKIAEFEGGVRSKHVLEQIKLIKKV